MRQRSSTLGSAFRIAILYAIFGALWILFSDMAVSVFFQNPDDINAVQLYKGWFFILVTAVFVFMLVRREFKKRQHIADMLHQKQKLEAIGLLTASVAHDINNPLSSVLGYLELLDITLPDEDKEKKNKIQRIRSEAQRIKQIVQSLQSFAHKEISTDCQEIDVCEMIRETVSFSNTLFRHDEIPIELKLSSELPKVKCVETQIQQVLLHLMTNARDALNQKYPKRNPNKKIVISAGTLEDRYGLWVDLTVEDFGAGMKSEEIERAFEPFYTTKIKSKGTGLGLAISKGIIKEHKGRLEMNPKSGSSGLIVHLQLPAISPD